MLDPKDFNIFFRDDFIKLSGFVAETIYRRRSNLKSSKEDFRQWVGITLIGLPERLSSKYQSFILEYIFQVLISERNWSNITAISLALVEEDTLSYKRVFEVIEQNQVTPVI